MSRCGIIILAAGASTRMGLAKQSLEFEGSTLLLRAVKTALGSQCRPVVVVLGARADELQPLLKDEPVDVVRNDNWERGIGTSIRAGILTIRGQAINAVIILLCDQPLISAAVLDRMIAAHFEKRRSITAAFYAGQHGTPAIFSAELFDSLLDLEDQQGGKAVLQRYATQVHSFPLPEAELDVDTPEDFKKLADRREPR